MRPATLLLPLLFVSCAQACINDRDSDSLARQAKKLPETLRVITGRFERNPPLYNEMRIQRSLASLQKNPRQFGLYDDIGAAYDRLRQDDVAVGIMEKKRGLLPPYNAKNPTVKEAWYRYYANSGTFRAHRWLGAGAQKATLGEMKTARAYIARAIEIKPTSHFKREKYQLMTMDWIIATREQPLQKVGTLGDWLSRFDGWEDQTGKPDNSKAAIEGMSGLIVLGSAWQSPDTFQALATALQNKEGVTLSYLAMLRCEELLRSGKKSLNPESLNLQSSEHLRKYPFFGDWTGIAVNHENQKTLDELFPTLRAEADTWQGHRAAFMLAKLEKGQHPDTDSHFWNGWKPELAPSLDVAWYNRREKRYDREVNLPSKRPYLVAFLAVATLGGGLLMLRGKSRKSET